ncbi:CsbD family protein [Streptomyces sp. NPDC006197]|uniref:CsbD family protein n=1 Tax=Streptomyces sp. NPDC006197 TaxID=3156685 RepID=UPI0033A247B6
MAAEEANPTVERLKGKLKEAAGRAVGNERMTGSGRAEQAKSDVRQAMQKIRDATKR